MQSRYFFIALLCLFLSIIYGCGIEWFPDTRQPDPFTFPTKNDVARSTKVESDAVKMSHNTIGSKVSISNGEWAMSNDNVTFSAWTTESGRIVSGQWLKVRHTSSDSLGTSTVTTITVQDYTTTFTSITTTVFTNTSTASPPPVPDETVYDSSGKIAASGLTYKETAKDATKATTEVSVSVSNTNSQPATVSVLVQAKNSSGIVVYTATIDGTVQGVQTTLLTKSIDIPIATYNTIAKWALAPTEVTVQ